MKRRKFLKGSLASVTTVAIGGSLFASNMAYAEDATKKEAPKEVAKTDAVNPFKTTSVEDALKALGITPEASDKIEVVAPDLAENAAVVPVEVKTSIEGAEEIHVMISNNPTVYAAKFTLGEGIDPAVKCRFKVGKTGDVIAIVKAGDKYYTGKKAVKVTKGGCGG